MPTLSNPFITSFCDPSKQQLLTFLPIGEFYINSKITIALYRTALDRIHHGEAHLSQGLQKTKEGPILQTMQSLQSDLGTTADLIPMGPPEKSNRKLPKLDEGFLEDLIQGATEEANRLDIDEPYLVIPWETEEARPESHYEYPTVEVPEWEIPAPECAPYGNRNDPENESS